MKEQNILKLIMEMGILARTPRTGPYHFGITNHETSGAHTFRVSILAYFIAKEESADADKVLKMSLFHDIPESRVLNQTLIQKDYVKEDQTKAFNDQLRGLKGSDELKQLFQEFKKRESLEAKIVIDANTLEALIEAKEYIQQGVKPMERMFQDKRSKLHTKTAQKLFDALEKETIYWWKPAY